MTTTTMMHQQGDASRNYVIKAVGNGQWLQNMHETNTKP